MKLTLISLMALIFTFIAYPTYSNPSPNIDTPTFNIFMKIGECETDYYVTLKLDFDEEKVIYRLYSPSEVTDKQRAALILNAVVFVDGVADCV